MTVESFSAEPAATPPPTMMDTGTSGMTEDQSLEKVWDRLMVTNGADRANDGRFESTERRDGNTPPLEGGPEGEVQADPSTVAADVPLPPNWSGKEDLWAKLPADLKGDLAEFSKDLHAKSSDLGRRVAAYEPLNNVGAEVTDYLRQAAQRSGQSYDGPQTPAEGVSYLFNIQRAMDADPANTLVQIMDTYGVRDQIAQMLGGQPGPEGQGPTARENQLLAEVRRLEAAVRQNADPSRIEQIIDQKAAKRDHDAEVSRLLEAKPLAKEIEPEDLVFWINKAWKALGPDAAKSAVFEHAYTAAVEANPTLRAKSQAAGSAASDASKKAAGAKRATSVNVTSTGPGKARVPSEDELLEEVWSKHHKG